MCLRLEGILVTVLWLWGNPMSRSLLEKKAFNLGVTSGFRGLVHDHHGEGIRQTWC